MIITCPRCQKSFNIDEKFPKFGVAISGGADSMALAFLAKCHSIKNNIN